jgi:hypothetical protein
MEKILTACVKYRRKSDPDKDWFAVAHDHAGCYAVLSFLEVYDRYDEVEGFQTTDGRFVDRHEAYKIAKNAGQLINEEPSEILKSYNVNY